jgi:secreted Zn-dependent insulinase-like peptidase
MIHTQFHFTVHNSRIAGALDRLAQCTAAPLIKADRVEREVNNVHAEFSRNTNSDERRLSQLRRALGNRPYSKFSTGNIATLWDDPKSRNRYCTAFRK